MKIVLFLVFVVIMNVPENMAQTGGSGELLKQQTSIFV